MTEAIAEERLVAVRPTGERFEVVATIGRPYQRGPEEWACAVSLEGLHGKLAEMVGGSSLQALCLGVTLVRRLLSGFVEDGGKLFYPGTEDRFALAATFGDRTVE